MASNPMQRKTRNSFLLGIIVTLLITGVVIAMLLLMLKQKTEELETEKTAKKMVYTLTQNVKAGQVLTQDMFSLKRIHTDSIPNDATSAASVIESWFLQTKEGEPVYTDKHGLYLDRTSGEKTSDTIIEVLTNNQKEFEDSKGNKVAIGEYYVEAGGITEKVTSISQAQSDEYGTYFVDLDGNDKIVRVYEEATTGELYIFKLDTSSVNTTGNKKRIKKYIEIKNVPVLARVNMNANTVITQQLVVQSDEQITDDTRQEEYNVVVLPMDLMTSDYVDIRLMTPNGQNFVVVSKVQVEIPENADGTYVADTIKVNLREDEILAMSSAIVEASGIEGAKLYAVKYVDPAMQNDAYTTYVPNAAVTRQLGPKVEDGKLVGFENSNIVEIAEKELLKRYNNAAINVRNDYLQQLINSDAETYNQNVETKMDESIGNSLTTRQRYLESLSN